MNRDEHVAAAEEILHRYRQDRGPNTIPPMARALVHATLAQSAPIEEVRLVAPDEHLSPVNQIVRVVTSTAPFDEAWRRASVTARAELVADIRKVVEKVIES